MGRRRDARPVTPSPVQRHHRLGDLIKQRATREASSTPRSVRVAATIRPLAASMPEGIAR